MSHTKEGWRVTELDRVISDTMEKVNDDYFIADCFGPDAKSNARRIVACVNACAGNSTAWLEGYGKCLSVADNAKPFGELIDSVNAERDTYRELCGELLKCLVDAQNTLAHCKAGVGYQQRQTDTAIKVNSAITKAEKVLGGNNGTSN